MSNKSARELVDAAVAQKSSGWAKVIGLQTTEARFLQFREGVTEALHDCMRAHGAAGLRRYERFSDLRKDFLSLARTAEKTATQLRGVGELLQHLPPMLREPAFRLGHDPQSTAFELDGLAKAARKHAEDCIGADRGGGLKNRALEAFAKGVVSAYQDATGRTGVGRGARDGKLLDLYNAILPTARNIAKNVTGRKLEISDDPGEYLHRIASLLRRA